MPAMVQKQRVVLFENLEGQYMQEYAPTRHNGHFYGERWDVMTNEAVPLHTSPWHAGCIQDLMDKSGSILNVTCGLHGPGLPSKI
jgi:hypothetical protein